MGDPATSADRRREVVTRLTQVTHGGTAAVAAACAVAAMGSYALDGCPAADLITVALEEFDHMPGGTRRSRLDAKSASRRGGTWRPGAGGVTLDAADTLAAVVHVLATCGEDPDGAMRYAVGLGGDTDTVAAITGGILGCRTRGWRSNGSTVPRCPMPLSWTDSQRACANRRAAYA